MKVKQPKAYAEEEAQRNMAANMAAHAGEHDPTNDEGNDAAEGQGVPSMHGTKHAEASDDGRAGKSRRPDVRGKKGNRGSAALGLPPGGGKARNRQAPQVGNARSGPGGGRTGPGPGDRGRAKGKTGGLARI